MSYAPIAGNQNFSRVRDMAGQIPTVSAGEVKAVTVSANKVSSSLPALAPSFAAAPFGKTLVEVELKTPAASGVAGAAVALVRLDGTAYTTPSAINVVSATLLGSSDLAGGGATDLGKSGGGGATVLLTATPAANLVAGGGVSVSGAAATLAFASTGVPDVVAIGAGLSIVVTPAAAYTAGSLRARLVYYV